MKSTTATTRPKTIRILKRDFDAAVAVPWSTTTCILAQAAIRTGLRIRNGEPDVDAVMVNVGTPQAHAMDLFDEKYRVLGDHNKPALQALRASLPIVVTLKAPSVGRGPEKSLAAPGNPK